MSLYEKVDNSNSVMDLYKHECVRSNPNGELILAYFDV